MTDTEVLVVGGGPVGLAAAIEARLAGLDVVVVEPRSGPVDKACGEGLMPGTLRELRRLGVDPDGYPLRGISYRSRGRSVDHGFRAGAGRGVRRTTLHAALLERAHELGVGRVTARVGDLTNTADRVEAGGVSARWLLACDGLHSTVRRLTGLEVTAGGAATRRFGLRRHYGVAPWTDLVEVHWARSAEAYVTPVAPDLVGVALLGAARTGWAETLTALPELNERLQDASVVGSVMGAGPLRQRTVARTAGRVRLVGDASGYVDALTGEGLRVGLAQARAAVATLDDPAAYERAWRRVTRDYRWLTLGLVAWAMSPARTAIVPVARSAPWLYGSVVERLAR
jgi:flavin-dependent dehydrogenase